MERRFVGTYKDLFGETEERHEALREDGLCPRQDPSAGLSQDKLERVSAADSEAT